MQNPDKARKIVFNYVKSRLEKTDTHVTFAEDEVYIVWFCYILGGWKALVSTTLPDGMYYEVTFNKINDVAYLDAYKKWDNVEIRDIPPFATGTITATVGVDTGSFKTTKWVTPGVDQKD